MNIFLLKLSIYIILLKSASYLQINNKEEDSTNSNYLLVYKLELHKSTCQYVITVKVRTDRRTYRPPIIVKIMHISVYCCALKRNIFTYKTSITTALYSSAFLY